MEKDSNIHNTGMGRLLDILEIGYGPIQLTLSSPQQQHRFAWSTSLLGRFTTWATIPATSIADF
ncbi:hypothetical protein Ancab_019070 [Ancistrocladus abbreviatus]